MLSERNVDDRAHGMVPMSGGGNVGNNIAPLDGLVESTGSYHVFNDSVLKF